MGGSFYALNLVGEKWSKAQYFGSEKFFKKICKNRKKGVDKPIAVWYYSNTAKNAGGFERSTNRKKRQEDLEN